MWKINLQKMGPKDLFGLIWIQHCKISICVICVALGKILKLCLWILVYYNSCDDSFTLQGKE